MKVRLNLAAVRRRGSEYEKAAKALGQVSGNVIVISRRDFEGLPKPVKTNGLGDLIERCLGRPGLLFKRTFRRVFGRECGCEKRKRQLNRIRF